MSKVSLMPLDTFNVVNHSYLNENDRKLLTMLYQPIVGSIGINLYYNLWTFLDKGDFLSESFNHKALVSIMGNTLRQIEEAREKLEGVGLLKVYLKCGEVNDYIYDLNAPLSAYEFYANPILACALHTSLGNINYSKTKEFFKVPRISLKDYEDVTENFSDVFCSVAMIETDVSDIQKRNIAEIGINSKLDIDNILDMVPELMINRKKVSKANRELIVKLSYIYNFDDKQTIEVISASINEETHNIDVSRLKENYRNLYKFEFDGELPSIIFKSQPDNLKIKLSDTSSKARKIYDFDNLSPYAFLCKKNHAQRITLYEVQLLEMLLIDMKLKPGVVNVLLEYVLKLCENKLPKQLIEAIAGQWKKSKIETVIEAMEISKREYKKDKESKAVQYIVKKNEEKADWVDKEVEVKEDIDKEKELEALLGRM